MSRPVILAPQSHPDLARALSSGPSWLKIHRTRNTAITNWLRAGTDLYTTMHLAGHKNPKVTERYAGGFSDEELARLARPAFSMIYGKKAS